MTSITLLLAVAASFSTQTSTPQRIGLEGNWRLTQPARKIDVPAIVPGTVQTDLLRNGKIPDPFFGSNIKAVQWVGEVPWSYARSFSLPASFLKRRRIVLRCEGLDTLARIELNGKELARTDNMFRTWEFDVRPLLRTGSNRVRIDFEPVEPYLKAHLVQAAFPGKSADGWGYIRKSPFQGGWDFAPRLVTSGIWRKIGLVGWNDARLTDVDIVQRHAGLDVKIAADTVRTTRAHVTVLFKGHKVAESDTVLKSGSGETHLTISKPQLWWPVDMGPQNLYDVQVDLRNSSNQTLDHAARRIGLRTIAWLPKTATTPLTLTVNGRPFFARGSNWVPTDALVRSQPEHERQMVQLATANHMNLMRLWGGGYYESDEFLNACDEKGLLVWFEFKFADGTYPIFDPKWLDNVKAEAADNVRRVRHHPSIAVYSGNNECIGFIADKTDPGHMSRSDYNLLFHETLGGIVKRLDPNASYTPGSPEIGDDHDWDVWHGSSSFSSYRDVHGFLSEYGFQAFPTPASVAAFTTPAGRKSVLSPVMEAHQRNWRDGNQLILSTLLRSYREPKDFNSILWLSQIQQAAGVLTGVEHWRRDWPHSTGSLVWQFNDCWPSISWSMIDSYVHPKALYYRLGHAYAPVALSGLADGKTGAVSLWVVNDRKQSKIGRIDWTLMRPNGTPLAMGTKTVSIPAGTSSTRAISLDESAAIKKEGAGNLLLWAELHTPQEPLSSTVLFFARPKDLALVDPRIHASVASASSGYRITLTSARPALWAWVELAGVEAKLSDNFVDLRPGKTVTILVEPSSKTTLASVRRSLRVRSLYDTYRPGEPPNPITLAEPSGRIVATAERAEILGDAAILEAGAPGNIGNWVKPSDSLQWTIQGAKSGVYKVTATVSIPTGEAGSTFAVEIDGSQLTAAVPGTGGWTTYRQISLGKLTIKKPGNVQMTLKPITKPHDHIMNLRSIVLTPS